MLLKTEYLRQLGRSSLSLWRASEKPGCSEQLAICRYHPCFLYLLGFIGIKFWARRDEVLQEIPNHRRIKLDLLPTSAVVNKGENLEACVVSPG